MGSALWSALASARPETKSAFDPDGERIVELVLDDNSLMNEGLVIYPFADDWVFPLGEVARSLSVAIQLSARLSMAEGFVADPSHRFKLDLKKCTVEYSGNRETFDCAMAFVHHQDIYVHRQLLQKWIPSKISVNPLRSQVILLPKVKLPVQARLERERLLLRSGGQRAEYDPGYPRKSIEHSWADGLFAEAQIGLNHRATSTGSESSVDHSTQLAGELLGFEASSLLSGTQRKFDTIRFSLARIAGNNEEPLFGPLKIREFRLVDVSFPPLPLVSGSSTGRGIFVSTFRIDRPTTFESAEIQGPLAPGWEIVLYRNDVLIDRQLSDGGRYQFKAVPLFYGRNSFRLSFFGPQGERRDEYRNYNISPELLVPGEINYRFGIARLDDRRQHMFAEYAQNFAKYFTMSTGIFHDRSISRSYGYVGLTGVNELFLFTTNCAMASDGGKACEWGPQFGVQNLTLGGKYTRLFNFRSDKFNKDAAAVQQEAQFNANLSYFFRTTPGLNLTFEFVQQQFANKTAVNLVTNRLAMGTGQFLFNNEVNYEFAKEVPLSGQWEITFAPSSTRYTLDASYNLRRVTSLGTSVQINQTGEYNFLTGLKYDTELRRPQVSVVGSKLFEKFTLGFNAASDFKNTHSVGLLFGIGGILDARQASVRVARPPVVSQGGAMVRVFKDLNGNGELDLEDIPMPNFSLKLGERVAPGKTDERGEVFLRELRPHSPSDIAINQESMVEDPYLRPQVEGYRISPRAGKLARLSLPVMVVGEIDGYVQAISERGGARQPLRGVLVQLLDATGKMIGETRTDEEGFYTFASVRVGDYQVRPSPDQMSENNLRPTPSSLAARIEPEGSFVSLEEFLLQETAKRPESSEGNPQAPSAAPQRNTSPPARVVEPNSGISEAPPESAP